MIIAIRVDASLRIGNGHVMRCRTLALELRRRGVPIFFLCRRQPGDLIALLKQDFKVLPLPERPSEDAERLAGMQPDGSLLGCSQEQDAADSLQALRQSGINCCNWLVVDHYGLDSCWELNLRAACRNLMVIDDLADRSHICDLLLDQSLHEQPEVRYRRLVPHSCKLLYGPKNVILSPAFSKPQGGASRCGDVGHVIVFFGSNDCHNQVGIALNALGHFPQLTAEVILGPDHPHKAAVYDAASSQPQISVTNTCDDMASAMMRADLALGVCGMAGWERCAMGLPSLVCVTAENQREDTFALHRLGAVEYVGDADELNATNWVSAINRTLANPERVVRMGEAARDVVAGHRKNFERLANFLCEHGE